jgi:class 3 adenylate cyclase
LDLEAVADQAGFKRFALMGLAFGTMVCVIYALRHPERVSAIIGMAPVMSGRAFWDSPRNKALRAMREADFDTYLDYVSRVSTNPAADDVWRKSITPEGQKAFVDASDGFDVTDLLPQLDLPVLLLYRSDFANAPDEGTFAREMATRVRGAKLASVRWQPHDVYAQQVASAVEAFLGATAASAPGPSAIQTVLFTDLASSTALTQRLGDAKAQELVRAHNTIVREALSARGGSEIKHTGDGIMASFSTASGALECAIAIQRSVASAGVEGLAVHIGLNAGEPVVEERDLFGTAVQLARRICDTAEAGEILVSDVVRQLAAGKNFPFGERDAVALKGFEEPVRLFEVLWRD